METEFHFIDRGIIELNNIGVCNSVANVQSSELFLLTSVIVWRKIQSMATHPYIQLDSRRNTYSAVRL